MTFKNILITGASSGIGRAVALEFAKHKTPMLLLSRNTDSLEKLTAEIKQISANVRFLKCDATDKNDIRKAVDYANELFGNIELAFLNAGVEKNVTAIDFNTDTLHEVFDVNFFGMAEFIRELVPSMKDNGGTISGVTSLADARAFPGSTAYCASKIAASFMLESFRAELKNSKIRIVTVKPGFVRTPMTNNHPYYMPFLMSADKAAMVIFKGLTNGKSRIYFPKRTAFLTYLLGAMPDCCYDAIAGLIGKFKKAK